MNDALPPRDHNNPPTDIPTGEALKELLTVQAATVAERIDELIRTAENIPETLTSHEHAVGATDFAKLCSAALKEADALRGKLKAPYWDGGKMVDGYFGALSDPLEKVSKSVLLRLTLYGRELERRERELREENERKAKAAEKQARSDAEAAAKAIQTDADLDAAMKADAVLRQAEADVVVAEKLVAAPVSKLSQVRGEYGSLSSLQTRWIFSELDRATLDLEALRPYLPIGGLETAVNAFIKTGGRTLRGVKIHKVTKAVSR